MIIDNIDIVIYNFEQIEEFIAQKKYIIKVLPNINYNANKINIEIIMIFFLLNTHKFTNRTKIDKIMPN